MVTSYKQIEEDIRSEWSDFETDFDRAVNEMADSVTPIYNSDIIREWSGLSSDDSDRWHEFGYSVSEMVSIVDLMKIDLFIYYQAVIDSIANTILEEKEEAN